MTLSTTVVPTRLEGPPATIGRRIVEARSLPPGYPGRAGTGPGLQSGHHIRGARPAASGSNTSSIRSLRPAPTTRSTANFLAARSNECQLG